MYGNFNNATNAYDPAPGLAADNSFNTYGLEAKYVLHLLDNLTLTPAARYMKSYTWYQPEDWVLDYSQAWYRPNSEEQYKGGVTASWDATRNINLTAGVESIRDYAEQLPSEHALDVLGRYFFQYYITNQFQAYSNTQSVFAEVNARTEIVDITLGARSDQNSQFGPASVPRLALTKEFGDYHVKCLASRAYRAPTLSELFMYNPNLKPEYATVYELEFGQKLTRNASITVNLFDTKIEDIITYAGNYAEYVANGYFAYANRSVAASRGIEAQYRLLKDWGYLNLAYSYYKAYDNTVVETIPMDAQGNPVPDVTLGFPTHKATLNASVKIGRGWSAAPGLIWFSQRYVTYTDDYGNPAQKILDSEFLANLYFRHTFSGAGFELGLGVFNLFDQKYWMAPGCYDDYSETSGPSREYVVKAKYSF
jgi:outer membrane cobalamin receptor